MHVRYCPDCRCEYLLHIERCADCGGELVQRLEGEEAPEPAAPAVAPEPASEVYEVVRTAGMAAEVQELVARLADAGVAYKVNGRWDGFQIGVRPEDRDKARKLLHEEAAEAETQGSEGAFGPGEGYSRCPACSSDLPTGAVECPECGLQLTLEVSCPRCEAVNPPNQRGCQECGASLVADD